MIASFLYPFRGCGRPRRWLVGVCLVALLPVTFPVVFGYAVECMRSACCDAAAGPPRWRLSRRLLRDGGWAALQSAVLAVPFALACAALAGLVAGWWHPTGDAGLDAAFAWIVAVTAAALPWGLLALTLVPPTLASFAVTGRVSDLARVGLVVACVRGRYADWNLVLVAITTSWVLAAVGLAFAGAGVVPGAFYAILVSAHACSALAPDRTAR